MQGTLPAPHHSSGHADEEGFGDISAEDHESVSAVDADLTENAAEL
jgi:hypothetical protein